MANQKDLELFLKGVKAWNEGVENGGAPARLLDSPITFIHHPLNEGAVARHAGEIPAAPYNQGLCQGGLKPVVGLLRHAVFVRRSGVGTGSLETVVLQQGSIALGQGTPFRFLELVGSRREIVGADHLRQPTQGPKRTLQHLFCGQANRTTFSPLSALSKIPPTFPLSEPTQPLFTLQVGHHSAAAVVAVQRKG